MTAQDRPSDEDRRKHLDFIEAIITRMSAASSSAKGWLLPVVTATYGYAAVERGGRVVLLGIAAVLLFMYVDANYLRLERAYRGLYARLVKDPNAVPVFSLKLPETVDEKPSTKRYSRAAAHIKGWFPERAVWLFWSVLPFYGGLLAIGLLLLVFGLTG